MVPGQERPSEGSRRQAAMIATHPLTTPPAAAAAWLWASRGRAAALVPASFAPALWVQAITFASRSSPAGGSGRATTWSSAAARTASSASASAAASPGANRAAHPEWNLL